MSSNNYLLALRRLRLNRHIRELTREVHVTPGQFIQPLFVIEGLSAREPVPGLPGVYRESPTSLLEQIAADLQAGVSKFILFGVPAAKATQAFDFNFTADQIGAIKHRFGDQIWLAADVCLCSATSHGHCGILNGMGDQVLNAATVAELARAALSYAQAGADCVAPSDMMDGRVAAIRDALNNNGCEATIVMSYAAKFHSRLYGPFREAADSAPRGAARLTDRASYQIDPGRPADALASAQRDASEGADILMVKPGLAYLDVLARLSTALPTHPWAAYEVSGEYAAIEALAAQGLTDGPRAHAEAWHALVRAGAQIIISYGARHARPWLALYGNG